MIAKIIYLHIYPIMITLYHGSLEIVENPEIRHSNRTLDYGAGFYLTSSLEQAEKWVRTKIKDNLAHGFLNFVPRARKRRIEIMASRACGFI